LVDNSRTAELQVLLEGVPLPATKDQLLEYAVRQRAAPQFLEALGALPDREYVRLDEVGEELVHVQPTAPPRERRKPSEESGDPPGGGAYTDTDPEPGRVRDG
jgi:hypothetical protein